MVLEQFIDCLQQIGSSATPQCHSQRITSLCTSIYLSINLISQKLIHDDAQNCNKWLEPLLFVIQDVPQAATRLSPFELLYNGKPSGAPDIIHVNWETGPSTSGDEIQYILDLRAIHRRLVLLKHRRLCCSFKDSNPGCNHLGKFTPGNMVFVSLLMLSSKLGLFEVTQRFGDTSSKAIEAIYSKFTTSFS